MISPSTNGHRQQASDTGTPGEEPGSDSRAGDQDPLTPVLARLHELREYASYYVAAHLDQARMKLNTALTWAALLFILALIAASMTVAAGVLLVAGLSSGLALLLNGHVWLAQIIAGAGLLAIGIGGTWFFLDRRRRAIHRRMVSKYERRKHRERSRFGTDVEQRAAASRQRS